MIRLLELCGALAVVTIIITTWIRRKPAQLVTVVKQAAKAELLEIKGTWSPFLTPNMGLIANTQEPGVYLIAVKTGFFYPAWLNDVRGTRLKAPHGFHVWQITAQTDSTAEQWLLKYYRPLTPE